MHTLHSIHTACLVWVVWLTAILNTQSYSSAVSMGPGVCVHLYVFQLVLQVCPLGLQKVRLVQRVLKSLSQSEDVALLHVQLLLQFCLLREKDTLVMVRMHDCTRDDFSSNILFIWYSKCMFWVLVKWSTSSMSLCLSSLSVSSFCCRLHAFISSMVCFFSRSLSWWR